MGTAPPHRPRAPRFPAAPAPDPAAPAPPSCARDTTLYLYSFDYELLVMQWGPAFGQPPKGYFTLHGMWPSRSGSNEATYPCDCTQEPLNATALARQLEFR